ncbi:MAG: 6,7-dimethyl-8-ribityllumazine synthase [Rhodospirillaceae bacterium]|nr:6,7-dimethyl-8-ribityllumazine synthase [Rhodospirillaceae bacterium]
MKKSRKVIIVEARFYLDISDQLIMGATQALQENNYQFERVEVPGILEIPHALKYAIETDSYDGGVVVGCAIKGQTDHYEHVCNQAMTGTQTVALMYNFPIGNAILTCPSRRLAEERASTKDLNFGGKAVAAALKLIKIKSKFRNA